MWVRAFPWLALAAALSCSIQGPTPLHKRVLVPNPHFAAPTGEYGLSETNPVLVGSLPGRSPPAKERAFLDRLRGPAGQRVAYVRRGSCCLFPTPNGLSGDTVPLDRYEVTYEGLAHPLSLYLNMYDPGEVRAPLGFTLVEE
jgi:hypothetical protein